MTYEESNLLDKLRGVKGWLDGLRSGPNPEYGFLYDNFGEFKSLQQQVSTVGKSNPEIEDIMLYLQADLEEVQRRRENPIRTEAEEAFRRHIVGINSYVRETKQREPGYVFDNVSEVEGLLTKVEALGTQDPDILSIMGSLTRDIKKTIAKRENPEAAEQYQERLTALNIGVPALQK